LYKESADDNQIFFRERAANTDDSYYKAPFWGVDSNPWNIGKSDDSDNDRMIRHTNWPNTEGLQAPNGYGVDHIPESNI